LVALALSACGGGGISQTPSSGPSSPKGNDAIEQATRRLCGDLLLIQSGFRTDALARLGPKLVADATAFAAAGDATTAKAIRGFSKAIAKLRQALLQHAGVDEAQHAVLRALGRLPAC